MSQELIRALATYRVRLEQLDGELKEAKAKLEATPKHQKYVEALTRCNEVALNISATENTLRKLALEAYVKTKETQPWGGVQIKLFTVVKYDAAKAEAWARLKAPTLLSLDKKAFEKVAKSGLPDMPATVVKEAHAQIDRDLSQYLIEEKDTEHAD